MSSSKDSVTNDLDIEEDKRRLHAHGPVLAIGGTKTRTGKRRFYSGLWSLPVAKRLGLC
jgi:hypothetical protein